MDVRHASDLDQAESWSPSLPLPVFKGKGLQIPMNFISFLPPAGVDVSKSVVYMAGNSLGLQPKGAKDYVDGEMEKWARR